MQFVDSILYRRLTNSEYILIEGLNKPGGGGGQTYIDLAGIPKEKIREFFANSCAWIDEDSTKTDLNGEVWPAYKVPMRVLGTGESEVVHFDVRSARRGQYRNYRISNQSIRQSRHIAWLPKNGFPTIIDAGIQVGKRYDTGLLEQAISRAFSQLVILIIKTKLGKVYSSFVVGQDFPQGWPSGVGLEEILTKPGTGIVEPTTLLQFDPADKEEPFQVSDVQPYSKKTFFSEVFMEEEQYDTIVRILERKKNIILQGSPGTGKTFAAKRIAYSIMGAKDESCVCAVQFHQSSAYEDYIYGYRPDDNGQFVATPGVFYNFFVEASKKEDENFYLIIDEINRANISKVFGEMLMAIEADHRGESVSLALAENNDICVPENVYIIGMMNTADRGLALIDYALRRRFAFVEMQPALENSVFVQQIEDTQSDELRTLVDLVKELNEEISADPSLGSGFTIGHSYFCLKSPVTKEDVASIINYELAPLIREYWFDQPETAESKIDNLKAALSK